jgi:type II secretory pathway component PulJ
VTLLEVLIASAISLGLLIGVYEIFVAGSKGMARAESKLEYLSESNLAFLHLRRDLHTVLAPPPLKGTSGLRVYRWQTSVGTARLTSQVVLWKREEGPAGPALVRRVEEGDVEGDERERRFGQGALQEFRIEKVMLSGRSAIRVRLTFKAANDAVATQFERTFFPQEAHVDRTWREVP